MHHLALVGFVAVFIFVEFCILFCFFVVVLVIWFLLFSCSMNFTFVKVVCFNVFSLK